ncbi:Integrase core domain-containing protein [Desulfacinum hydrothermale DSM 13146]|uniref:Integrase core domain-containing protein n=1 Tax=Desulfacinum hydrothermale DSM 13146 TaxID=1121390 RepID=A0A1W1XS84_9BACT|nr:Integrase core domain-containing protein [Desulfacinum hydrothermale DSM 13146]
MDITKLLGPVKWTYFYLYVIMNIFSRYVVGWMVAHRESAALAKRLIEETCKKQGIVHGQLTVHADRGSSMTSPKFVTFLRKLLLFLECGFSFFTTNFQSMLRTLFKGLRGSPRAL